MVMLLWLRLLPAGPRRDGVQAVEAPKGVAVIRVEDTLRAYQDLARSYRMGIKI
jgi:hypothetical protein